MEEAPKLARLLRVAEFAEETGLAEITVRKWIRQERLASVKLGRARRIPSSELRRLEQEGLAPRPDDSELPDA